MQKIKVIGLNHFTRKENEKQYTTIHYLTEINPNYGEGSKGAFQIIPYNPNLKVNNIVEFDFGINPITNKAYVAGVRVVG
ncbi:MAG: hypothetical protein K0Q49_2126 [Haloplasmataceae bacterium]|jgi:hypothetical protein|nr:hypothetical protein [Haloplasmataceae bacterium]